VPPWGLGELGARVHGLLDGEAGRRLGPETVVAARKLADAVPGMVAELAACGLPETVVHGDFHPGNWRWDGDRVVLVDFADSGVGNPVLDGLRPGMYLRDARAAVSVDAWAATWREHRPGCDPVRALELARPLARLGYAVTYQRFLDNIETSERRYHSDDPAGEIRTALAAAGYSG
jgi:Ser/Thr protein kinase RdoA (MazF antagonist)